MTRAERSALAKFRCGTAPIRIETGRYEGIATANRLCVLGCNAIENEEHVLIDCPTYDDLRQNIYQSVRAYSEFDIMNSAEKLVLLSLKVARKRQVAMFPTPHLSVEQCILYNPCQFFPGSFYRFCAKCKNFKILSNP